MLDKFPPPWRVAARDAALMLLATLIQWGLSDVVPVLKGQGGQAAVIATCLVMLANVATPWLTKQYGAGAPPAAPKPPSS